LMSIKFTYFYILFLFFVGLFFYKYYTKKKNSEYEEHSSLFNNL
jgi:cbb3-type cytochrome oxidase subunit 3